MLHVLDRVCRDWRTKSIHESSPSNDYIKNQANHYQWSQYLPEAEPGTFSVDGTRCENLESLTLESESIDIFIAQDVLEHVFTPAKAVAEVLRVIKAGGFFIFTCPRHVGVARSYPMALLSNNEIKHIQYPPEYHGSPVGDGQSLVTWKYGDDFEVLLAKWSGCATATYYTKDWSLGIDAEFNEVFVIKKAN